MNDAAVTDGAVKLGARPATSEPVMEAKKRPGNEQVKPDSGRYPASERAYQGAFVSHPSGMALTAHRFVETLDREATAPLLALLLALHPASAMSQTRW